ncbi:hypothetical protein N7448_001429 [Penicillium atrosanguineum]|uniref:Vacuolar import and degradation protein 21 n=1 Tax=Penicillium atrosanguineum TaxID=1132637 RepID=A0A9W9U894_9EURO|nr:hypothetical protein N7448_001429 [Penicillium atrosanguineum]KAJ5324631.1 hypothetical protein N7476_003231 [Penicillium atrosanguineum]
MLRDELLRSKNDEIANCLLSRKRKLTELYYATVGFEGATADAHYLRKEQAFLEANDLSKGRYYDEATLPSPNHARARSPSIKPVASAISDSKAHPAAGITPPPTVDDNAPTGASPQAKPVISPLGVASSAEDAPTSSVSVIIPEASQGADASTPTAQSKQIGDQKASASVPQIPLSSQVRDGAEVKISPGAARSAATNATPSLEIPQSLPRKKHDSRPSLTLGPSNIEQPLSPASSIDPYSNNTPIPVAASPDTSPGEEVTDVDQIGRSSPKQTRSAHPRPGLVPATPDEQLRLEEAQSLKQKTGESVANAGLPSSNEVFQESVGPGADKDEMEVDQEPTVGVIESKLPDETASLSPTEQLSEGVRSTGDSFETPHKKPATIPSTLSSSTQPERMTTRVSSGAIRHKSVSEILGETPKALTHERSHGDETPDSVARMRFKDRKDREKERTRLSTVVFPKQTPTQQDKADSLDLIHRDSSDAVSKVNEEQDYLFTLFLNRAYAPPRGSHLNTLLTSAHKTLSTSNHLLEYQEQMDCRTLRRIYALQNANRWPLRQMKRSMEPPRQGSHWDVLVDHMKWMRTDFREERKWKIAAAKSCADWCAEYVNSDEEHRALLRIHAKIPTPIIATQDILKSAASPSEDTGDEAVAVSHPTPDLVPSAEEESVSDGFNEEPRHDLRDTVAPAAIFSLGSDEFNFSIEMTPAAEKLLDELPLYEPVRIAPEAQTPIFKQPPDSVWKTELLPVSKFASTKITFHDDERPRKRSRYDYSQYTSGLGTHITEIPPEQTNVALFRPENKHIRDRIHPGHSFRPPTEHPMPSVGFFESRQSSQWTMAEDDELRRLVKEYSYNWSLISSCLTSPSIFTSGAERRTPWECFERWVGLEGLPADMSKTQYFRAYHQRLETAQRTVLAQQQAAQQQQQQQAANNGQVQQPIRRRTTQPLRVDRRRSSRHLAMLDAMRKLAKKRETMLQKQQHASHLASLRKANEANQPKPPISSPAEFSRLKHEREQKLQERQEQYRQQMIAQQRANLTAQRAGQMPNQQQSQQQQQMMNAQGRTPNNMPPNSANGAISNGTPNGVANGLQTGVGVNQNRTQPMQGLPAGATPVNGQMQNNALAMKIMPQGQMQPGLGARPAVPVQTSPENDRIVREATRLQEQQRALQSRQQTQVPQQAGQPQQAQQQFHNQQFAQGSPNLNMPNGTNNPAMIAAMQAQGGMQSSSFHGGTPQGVSTPSPRMAQPNPLSSGVVPTISTYQSQIQQANPNLPLEQVNKMATDRLNAYRQQRSISQQAAMNAAAGGMNSVQANYQVPHDGNFQTPPQPGVPNGNPAMQVPQNQGFSPMMRVPQANQQSRVSVTSSPAMNGAVPQASRSATPQTQRSGSAQAAAMQGSSKSPHPPAAQTARS